jgi:agmatinase
MRTSLLALGYAALAAAHDGHDDQKAISSGPHESLWYHNALPGDGGTQVSFIPEWSS